jgi:c-di-GMP-binding flagellar brake protein YcgR
MAEALLDDEANAASADGKAASDPAPAGGDAAGDRVRFDAVQLKIGAPMQLQSTYEGERLPGALIGCIRGVSILVHLPRLTTKAFVIEEGQSLIVRMFSETDAYAFKAEILRRCLRPALYLHLALPDQAQRAPVRRNQRVKVHIPASVTRATGGGRFDAVITDLSVAGAKFEAAGAAIAKGEALRIAFSARLGDDEALFACDAQVRSVHAGSDAGRMQFGIEFSQLKLNDRLLVMGMVYMGLTGAPEA